jgi:hypothetical protein
VLGVPTTQLTFTPGDDNDAMREVVKKSNIQALQDLVKDIALIRVRSKIQREQDKLEIAELRRMLNSKMINSGRGANDSSRPLGDTMKGVVKKTEIHSKPIPMKPRATPKNEGFTGVTLRKDTFSFRRLHVAMHEDAKVVIETPLVTTGSIPVEELSTCLDTFGRDKRQNMVKNVVWKLKLKKKKRARNRLFDHSNRWCEGTRGPIGPQIGGKYCHGHRAYTGELSACYKQKGDFKITACTWRC